MLTNLKQIQFTTKLK